jgi:hypothetical protein
MVFLRNKMYSLGILGGGRAGGAPPGTSPDDICEKAHNWSSINSGAFQGTTNHIEMCQNEGNTLARLTSGLCRHVFR